MQSHSLDKRANVFLRLLVGGASHPCNEVRYPEKCTPD